MKCINENIGKLITRYELGLVDKQEKNAFENHLLECDVCYQDFYAMQPAIKLMRQNKQKLLSILEKEPKAQLKPSLINLDILKSNLNSFLLMLRQPHWGISAAIVIWFLFVISVPHPGKYGDMVNIKHREALPNVFSLRGGTENLKWMEYYQKGLTLYSDSAYDQASQLLSQSQRLNSNNSNIVFYLGLSFLLNSQPDSAIIYFKKTIVLRHEQDDEATWFLANAYLMNEEPALAQEQLLKINTNSKYKDQANALILKISQHQNKFFLLKWAQYLKAEIIDLLNFHKK